MLLQGQPPRQIHLPRLLQHYHRCLLPLLPWPLPQKQTLSTIMQHGGQPCNTQQQQQEGEGQEAAVVGAGEGSQQEHQQGQGQGQEGQEVGQQQGQQ